MPDEDISANDRAVTAHLKSTEDNTQADLHAGALEGLSKKALVENEHYMEALSRLSQKRAAGFDAKVQRRLTPEARRHINTLRQSAMETSSAAESRESLTDTDRFMEFYPGLEGREGGQFTNYPDDPGGPTKFGATQKQYSAYQAGKNDKTPESPSEVKNLTREQAQKFFREHYYDRYRAGEIKDDRIAEHLFDITVNPGPERSAKWAQEAVNAVKGTKSIPEDGIMGSITIGALNELSPGERQQVMDLVAEKRANHYRERAKVDTHVKKKIRGLLNRAYSFRLKKGKQ